VAFSPGMKGLVSGGIDGILRYWDASSLGDMEIGRVIGSDDRTVRIWDPHTAERHFTLHIRLTFTLLGAC